MTLQRRVILIHICALFVLIALCVMFQFALVRNATVDSVQENSFVQALSLRDQYETFFTAQENQIRSETDSLLGKFEDWKTESNSYQKELKYLDLTMLLNDFRLANSAYAACALFTPDLTVCTGIKIPESLTYDALSALIGETDTAAYPATDLLCEASDTKTDQYLPIAVRSGELIHLNLLSFRSDARNENPVINSYIVSGEHCLSIQNAPAPTMIPSQNGSFRTPDQLLYAFPIGANIRIVSAINLFFLHEQFTDYLIFLILAGALIICVGAGIMAVYSRGVFSPFSRMATELAGRTGFAPIRLQTIDHYPHRNFKDRLFVLFSVALLLPLFLFNVLSLGQMASPVRSCLTYNIQSAYDSTFSFLEYQLSGYANLADQLVLSDAVQNFFYSYNGLEYFDAERMPQSGFNLPDPAWSDESGLRSYLAGNIRQSGLQNVLFFDADGKKIGSLFAEKTDSTPSVFGSFLFRDGSVIYSKQVLSVYPVRTVGASDNGTRYRMLGSITIVLSPDELTKNFLSLFKGPATAAYISDGNDSVFPAELNGIISSENPLFSLSGTIPNTSDWTFHLSVSKNVLDDQLYPLIIFSLSVGIAIILLSLLLSAFLSKKFSKDLLICQNAVSRANSLNACIAVRSDYSEIASLVFSFNDLMQRLNHTTEQLTQESLRTQQIKNSYQKAELISFQSQLDPHFLHNVFASINILIAQNHNEDARQMVLNLSKMFKLSIYRNIPLVRVREETEHLAAYLALQKIRFRDRISCMVDIEEDIFDALMLKLLLQPVVENSFKHGIEPRGSGNIRVRGSRQGDLLIFTVEDNGVGIPESRLQELRDSIRNCDMEHCVGLANLQKRIQLYYGEEYGIAVQSEEGVFTEITLTIPYLPPQRSET